MEVVVRAEKDATVIDLHGRLDFGARWDFKAVMNQCILREENHLILNLRGLSFLDSAGLGFLVLSHMRFVERNKRMSLVHPRGPVKSVLDNLNISSVIPIFDSEQEALSLA